MSDHSTAPIAIGNKAQVERSRNDLHRNTTKMATRSSTSSAASAAALKRTAAAAANDDIASTSTSSRSSTPMQAPITPAKEMTLRQAASNTGNGKQRQKSTPTNASTTTTGTAVTPSASTSWTPSSATSSICYLSESMRSSDQYAIYDMNHFRYGGSSYGGTPSPLIVSSVGQGFSWSRDGTSFLSLPLHTASLSRETACLCARRHQLTNRAHSFPKPIRTGALRRRWVRYARGSDRSTRHHPRRRAHV